MEWEEALLRAWAGEIPPQPASYYRRKAALARQAAEGVTTRAIKARLLERVEQEAKTTGGIIIPDTAQEKPMEGEVIAVGAGVRGEDGTVHPLDVKAGDRVLFGKWSGTEVKIDGEELMIMKESDVMGIVDSGAAAGNKS